MIKEKRGALGNQMLLIPFLLYIAMILACVGIGVYIYLGNGYDTRAAEADLLATQIERCVIDGKINVDFTLTLDEFYKKCGYSKEVIERYYIIKICQGGFDCIEDKNPIIYIGRNIEQCGFKNTADEFFKCKEKNIKVNGLAYTIITASNQKLRRVGT